VIGSGRRDSNKTTRALRRGWEISTAFRLLLIAYFAVMLMIAAATLMTWTSQFDRHGPKPF
jgi:predicted MFS family arabinose efflux permease